MSLEALEKEIEALDAEVARLRIMVQRTITEKTSQQGREERQRYEDIIARELARLLPQIPATGGPPGSGSPSAVRPYSDAAGTVPSLLAGEGNAARLLGAILEAYPWLLPGGYIGRSRSTPVSVRGGEHPVSTAEDYSVLAATRDSLEASDSRVAGRGNHSVPSFVDPPALLRPPERVLGAPAEVNPMGGLKRAKPLNVNNLPEFQPHRSPADFLGGEPPHINAPRSHEVSGPHDRAQLRGSSAPHQFNMAGGAGATDHKGGPSTAIPHASSSAPPAPSLVSAKPGGAPAAMPSSHQSGAGNSSTSRMAQKYPGVGAMKQFSSSESSDSSSSSTSAASEGAVLVRRSTTTRAASVVVPPSDGQRESLKANVERVAGVELDSGPATRRTTAHNLGASRTVCSGLMSSDADEAESEHSSVPKSRTPGVPLPVALPVPTAAPTATKQTAAGATAGKPPLGPRNTDQEASSSYEEYTSSSSYSSDLPSFLAQSRKVLGQQSRSTSRSQPVKNRDGPGSRSGPRNSNDFSPAGLHGQQSRKGSSTIPGVRSDADSTESSGSRDNMYYGEEYYNF